MGCRCTDINNCSKDITTLSQMIHKLAEMSEDDEEVGSWLSSLSSDSSASITPENIGDLTATESKLNDPISKQRVSLQNSCTMERSRLQAELIAMQAEDTAYHSSQGQGA